MGKQTPIAPGAVVELGPMGRELALALLAQATDDPRQVLFDVLTSAYTALAAGDAAEAQRVMGRIVGLAQRLEQALGRVTQAMAAVAAAQQALLAATPAAVTPAVVLHAAPRAAWVAALERSIAVQTELVERLTSLDSVVSVEEQAACGAA